MHYPGLCNLTTVLYRKTHKTQTGNVLRLRPVTGCLKTGSRGSEQANWLILFVIYLKTGLELDLYRPFWGQKEQYTQAH